MSTLLMFWWQRSGIASLIVLCVVILTYGPLYRADYAITDDYGFLLTDSGTGEVYLSDGRPVYYLAQVLIHSQISSLSQLAYLRFIGVVFTAILAVLFYHLIKHVGGSWIERTAFAIAMATLPCLHDPVAMALLWLTPIAALCASIAAWQSRRLVSEHRVHGKSIWTFASPLTLMLISGLIYQPMLAFYWTVVLVFVLDPRFTRSQTYRRDMALLIALGFFYFICCFLAMKACFYLTGIAAKERTQLADNPLEKIYWFARIQLPLALNYWQLMVSGSRLLPLCTAAATGGIMVVGYFTFLRRFLKKSTSEVAQASPRPGVLLLHLGVILGLVVLSHVHWLAIKELPQSYRIIGPLSVSVWVLMFWALRQISFQVFAESIRSQVRNIAMVSIAFLAVFVSQKHSEALFVESNSLAYRYVLYCLRDQLNEQHRAIHVILQGREDGLVADYYIESFGRPPAEAYWTINDWVRVAMRELDAPSTIESITYGDSHSIAQESEHTLVIDMRKLRLFRIGDFGHLPAKNTPGQHRERQLEPRQ